jgi:hypothetical protein
MSYFKVMPETFRSGIQENHKEINEKKFIWVELIYKHKLV